MVNRKLVALTVVLAIASMVPQLCLAQDDDQLTRHHKAQISQAVTAVEKSADVLKGKPKEQWGQGEVIEYLSNVGWLLYHSSTAFTFSFGRTPESIEELVAAQLLDFHPLNPVNDWEKMELLSESEGFSPGNAVIQRAPRSFYSIVGSLTAGYHLEALSFQLGVYGPDKSHSRAVSAIDENSWASPPSGLVIYLGAAAEPADMTIEKMKQNALRREQESQSGGDGGQK